MREFNIFREIQRVNAAYLAVNNLNGGSMATYLVKVTPSADDPVRIRLVNSKTRKGAVAHVAADTISAVEATTQDILYLGEQKVKLETAGAE